MKDVSLVQDPAEEQQHLPRNKRLEAIEAEYKTLRLKNSPYALDWAKDKLREYAKEYHSSDPFWFGRAVAHLKNRVKITP